LGKNRIYLLAGAGGTAGIFAASGPGTGDGSAVASWPGAGMVRSTAGGL